MVYEHKQLVEWVPLAERMPAKDGRYLIYAPSADPGKPLIAVAWYHPAEREWTLIPYPWANVVTHWMEVPTPPA
jgi:hypothetical protein